MAIVNYVIGGITLAGFAIYKVIKARRNAKHEQEEVEEDEFIEEETETEE